MTNKELREFINTLLALGVFDFYKNAGKVMLELLDKIEKLENKK